MTRYYRYQDHDKTFCMNFYNRISNYRDVLQRLVFLLPSRNVEFSLVGGESGEFQVLPQGVQLDPVGELVSVWAVSGDDGRVVGDDIHEVAVEGAREPRQLPLDGVVRPSVLQGAVHLRRDIKQRGLTVMRVFYYYYKTLRWACKFLTKIISNLQNKITITSRMLGDNQLIRKSLFGKKANSEEISLF